MELSTRLNGYSIREFFRKDKARVFEEEKLSRFARVKEQLKLIQCAGFLHTKTWHVTRQGWTGLVPASDLSTGIAPIRRIFLRVPDTFPP